MIQSRPGDFGQPATTADMPGQEPKDRLRQHTDEAKRQADQLRHQAGEAAHDAGERLREMGREAKDRASEAARQTSSQVREKASAAVAEQKNRLADEVSVFGLALHRAAETLEQNDDQTAGRYTHQAAEWIDSAANMLRQQDASTMIRGCSDFTRRHPELVLGGMFLAGVSIARFLKASDRPRERDIDRGYMTDDEYTPVAGDIYDDMTVDDGGYGDVELYAGDAPATYGACDPVATSADQIPAIPETEDIPNVTSDQPDTNAGMITDDETSESGIYKPR